MDMWMVASWWQRCTSVAAFVVRAAWSQVVVLDADGTVLRREDGGRAVWLLRPWECTETVQQRLDELAPKGGLAAAVVPKRPSAAGIPAQPWMGMRSGMAPLAEVDPGDAWPHRSAPVLGCWGASGPVPRTQLIWSCGWLVQSFARLGWPDAVALASAFQPLWSALPCALPSMRFCLLSWQRRPGRYASAAGRTSWDHRTPPPDLPGGPASSTSPPAVSPPS